MKLLILFTKWEQVSNSRQLGHENSDIMSKTNFLKNLSD